ncbi:hydantoinase/oxoprolinase family protein (plasmid) [Rhizobium sp. TRM96647]|uniref:hydantoinase/oxoprolinase family protein n=1 Tax=unclassified Rhizobium TaxID=2613769 RepID=UPI0021E78BC4|nr:MULTISPECIES: hydantoinase/oxoprolinase family protein [unclassified Rhizobium]MCV3735202.1 hydantoinase/oxoprolinase family protein [Rhizobium sp. TRM96647]MCV3758035.1 hydantoinase/oxoprolinase family protein [Rhizobium sp. TRM96650]
MRETPNQESRLRVAVDIGGTFTDGVATMEPAGRIWVAKSPTTPADPGQAVSTVLEDLLRQVDTTLGERAAKLREVVHGTTLITNTLIERKGVKTALVTTKGMKDVLNIGREWRYDIYDLDIELPKPLIDDERRVEVDARMDARGEELDALTDEDLDVLVRELSQIDTDSIAVSLLHSYTNTDHEKRIGEKLRAALPGKSISLSSDLAREIKEFERTSTVAANAYVKPIVEDYLEELDTRIASVKPGTPLRVMVSSGGFCSAKTGADSPILLLESGPAAGVLSALNTAQQVGVDKVLAFDMGGTTAKACVAVDGDAPVTHSFECARVERFKRGSGLPILIPSIELIEIGAGGGSIAHCNRLGLLNVGPESSGSVPGPACYGRGGTDVTVTDADLLLGYLNGENFLGGSMTLNKAAAQAAVTRLADQLGVSPLDATWGICNMVNENMASAARIHIAENGHDPRDFTMIATGGAGPVHAVDVARKLRIPRVIVPIAAGAGSCLGMLAAPPRIDRAWSRPQLLTDIDWSDVADNLEALRTDALGELEAAGATTVEWIVGAEMRYEGQGAEISVTVPYEDLAGEPARTLLNAFEAQYEKLYGRLVPNAAAQVITWRLVGRAPNKAHVFEWGDDRIKAVPSGRREIFLPLLKQFAEVPVYNRYSTTPGTILQGPLILEERESTIVVAVAADVAILPDLTVSVTIKEFD